jgi:hypothetical protein
LRKVTKRVKNLTLRKAFPKPQNAGGIPDKALTTTEYVKKITGIATAEAA